MSPDGWSNLDNGEYLQTEVASLESPDLGNVGSHSWPELKLNPACTFTYGNLLITSFRPSDVSVR